MTRSRNPISGCHEMPPRHFLFRPTRRDRGFTLIEILLAFFIFGIVAATVFGSYRSVFSSAESVLEIISDDEMGLTCMHRMVLDLSSVVVSIPPIYRTGGLNTEPDLHRLTGRIETTGNREFSALRFTSLAHVPVKEDPMEAVSEIRYFVEAAGPNRFVLKRSSRPYPFFSDLVPESAHLLCDRIKSLEFTFYNESGNESVRWDSDSADFDRLTPRAVQIRFEVGEGSRSRVFETRITLPVLRERARG